MYNTYVVAKVQIYNTYGLNDQIYSEYARNIKYIAYMPETSNIYSTYSPKGQMYTAHVPKYQLYSKYAPKIKYIELMP